MAARELESIDAIFESYYERGLTDGLPILPPTPERVQEMLNACGRDPGELPCVLPTTPL